MDLRRAREELVSVDIMNGDYQLPSWIRNKDKLEEFDKTLQALCKSRGIPVFIFDAFMQDKEQLAAFFYYAGALEARGASFSEQVIAVANKIQQMCKLT